MIGQALVKRDGTQVAPLAKFFTFNQNNSGGRFVVDHRRGISHYVIVEARSAQEANQLAEQLGLYFDGVGDCNCCGNRWSEAGLWGETGSDRPEVYSTPVAGQSREGTKLDGSKYGPSWFIKDGPEGYIHYLDNVIEPFWFGPTEKEKQS